jgi:hypothetical protein
METYEQKKRRLFGKQYLPQYLEEFNKILKIHVDATNLLSIVETDEIRQHILAKELKYKTKILFNEKEELKEIIFNSSERTNDKYYIFTSYSNDCGTLKINLLQDFNFDFSFKDEHVGLITFIREDLLEKIILDFYEENKIECLDIEILSK